MHPPDALDPLSPNAPRSAPWADLERALALAERQRDRVTALGGTALAFVVVATLALGLVFVAFAALGGARLAMSPVLLVFFAGLALVPAGGAWTRLRPALDTEQRALRMAVELVDEYLPRTEAPGPVAREVFRIRLQRLRALDGG